MFVFLIHPSSLYTGTAILLLCLAGRHFYFPVFTPDTRRENPESKPVTTPQVHPLHCEHAPRRVPTRLAAALAVPWLL